MKLVKYNKSGSGAVAGASGAVSANGGSGSTTNISGGSATLDRTIWGQYDEGDDIDGSMTINGNVHIQVIADKNYEEEDEDGDGEYEEEETGGGSLYVDEDIEVGRHLYINYSHPGHTTNKKCVCEILSGHETSISNNATEIGNLKTRVSTAENNISNNANEITNLKSRVSANETNISNNTTEINNLKTRVSTNETNITNNTTEINNLKTSSLTTDDVLKLIRDNQASVLGTYKQPVVLFAGRARRVTYNSNSYYFDGVQLPHFSLTNEIKDGLMTISVTADEGYQVNVYSVHATQERSGDTESTTMQTYHKERSNGAHWFECRTNQLVDTKYIYIKEFHQGNGDNDTWYSSDWFSDDGGIKAIDLTLFGYIQPVVS